MILGWCTAPKTEKAKLCLQFLNYIDSQGNAFAYLVFRQIIVVVQLRFEYAEEWHLSFAVKTIGILLSKNLERF